MNGIYEKDKSKEKERYRGKFAIAILHFFDLEVNQSMSCLIHSALFHWFAREDQFFDLVCKSSYHATKLTILTIILFD